MKVPLRFQVTEFDCGTVALLNAFSYLFEREEIPAEIVRAIHDYTLDCYDEGGRMGEGGTSREAVRMLSRWIVNFSKSKNFGVECKLYDDGFSIEMMRKTIRENGVLFIRTWQEVEHYVIVTDIDDEYAYIFDSYYLEANEYDDSRSIEIILDQPFKYNRKVKLSRYLSEQKTDFALGPVEKREIVVIRRCDKKK